MTQIQCSQTPDSAPAPTRYFPLLATGLGLFTSVFCAAALFGQPLGMALDRLSQSAEKDAVLARVFGATGRPQAMQVLAGINGVSASPGADEALAAEIVSDAPSLNIAPASWDRLSGGGCMTVTTKTGQSFSFRILGVHPGALAKSDHEPPKVDLAITACPAASESIVKAVIEPYAVPAKAVVPERSL